MNDPLSSLVIDSDELSRSIISETLLPFASFTKDGEIFIKAGFHGLSASQKVLVIILSQKALALLTYREFEAIGPTEISNISGIPLGTVKRRVRDLATERLLKSEAGKYYIPLFSLSRVSEYLRNLGLDIKDSNEKRKNN